MSPATDVNGAAGRPSRVLSAGVMVVVAADPDNPEVLTLEITVPVVGSSAVLHRRLTDGTVRTPPGDVVALEQGSRRTAALVVRTFWAAAVAQNQEETTEAAMDRVVREWVEACEAAAQVATG